jgi:hypothetical protein
MKFPAAVQQIQFYYRINNITASLRWFKGVNCGSIVETKQIYEYNWCCYLFTENGIAETLRIAIYWTRAYTMSNANDNKFLGDINNIIR